MEGESAVKRKKVTVGVTVAILALVLLAPVGGLFYLSNLEQAQYAPTKEVVHLEEQSYGVPVMITRTDVEEVVTVSGRMVSTRILYEELNLDEPYALRLQVETGDILLEGDCIGLYHGREIKARQTGMIRQIHLGSEAYLELWSLEDLALECYVTEKQYTRLQQENLVLKDSENREYTVLRMNPIPEADGTYKILLQPGEKTYLYGQSVSNLKLRTGTVYRNCLTVESRCVYSRDGGSTWYVRLVEKDGTVLGEQEVEVGFSQGGLTCISGVEEGRYCDSGYKSAAEREGAYAGF